MAQHPTSQKINFILKNQPKVSLNRINFEKIRTQGIKLNNIPMVESKKPVKRLATKKANVKNDCCATNSSPTDRKVSTRSAIKRANIRERFGATSSSLSNDVSSIPSNKTTYSSPADSRFQHVLPSKTQT